MPKTIPQSDFDAILEAVRDFPDGASVEQIRTSLKVETPRRTLQRRLATLVEDDRLVITGKGRSCRYSIPASTNKSSHSQSNKPMNRKQAMAILTRLKPELIKRFGVTRLGLFGSTVHNMAQANSDVDILVAFDGPATSKRYFGVQFLLEDELGHPVDLVTEKAIRPELEAYIDSEVVNV